MPLVLSDGQVRVLALLFPQLSDLELDQVEDTGASVRILARTRTAALRVPKTSSVQVRLMMPSDRGWWGFVALV